MTINQKYLTILRQYKCQAHTLKINVVLVNLSQITKQIFELDTLHHRRRMWLTSVDNVDNSVYNFILFKKKAFLLWINPLIKSEWIYSSVKVYKFLDKFCAKCTVPFDVKTIF